MKKLLIAAVVALGLTGCTTAPFQPSVGMVYSDAKAPLQLDYDNTDLGHRVGSAYTISVLGLFAGGDCSIQAAAKNGKIRIIKHADYRFTNILFGLFTKTTVYVYGD